MAARNTHITTIRFNDLLINSRHSVLAKKVLIDGQTYNGIMYHWLINGRYAFNIGFLIDPLSSLMMLIVTFVSLLVHVYTVGYMHDDPGYQRFFSYVSLFTFAMLMLVTANNFLQLFFGWEGWLSFLLADWFLVSDHLRRPMAVLKRFW